MKTRIAGRFACAVVAILASGCERQMADMYEQPKLKPLQESPLWSDGRASRPIPPDTIAFSGGAFAGSSSGREQVLQIPASSIPAENPLPITLEALKRGQQRFAIFCSPCHGYDGHGDGMVARRGFPHPPSYHIDRLRQAPDSHLFDVITNGYGAMYPYAERVPVDDRWAIVAYIRALQLSQHATLDDVPPEDRARMDQPASPVPP